MTTPPQQDAPTMFYPLNPCGHLRGPGGGCIGSPECKREPVSADKLGELVQRAGELRARLVAHPSQAFTGEGRATVADKLGAAVSLGECLSSSFAVLSGWRSVRLSRGGAQRGGAPRVGGKPPEVEGHPARGRRTS